MAMIKTKQELEDKRYAIMTVINKFEYYGCTEYRISLEMKCSVIGLRPIMKGLLDEGFIGQKMIDSTRSKRTIYTLTMKGADVVNEHLSKEEKKALRTEEEQKKIDMIEKLFE